MVISWPTASQAMIMQAFTIRPSIPERCTAAAAAVAHLLGPVISVFRARGQRHPQLDRNLAGAPLTVG